MDFREKLINRLDRHYDSLSRVVVALAIIAQNRETDSDYLKKKYFDYLGDLYDVYSVIDIDTKTLQGLYGLISNLKYFGDIRNVDRGVYRITTGGFRRLKYHYKVKETLPQELWDKVWWDEDRIKRVHGKENDDDYDEIKQKVDKEKREELLELIDD